MRAYPQNFSPKLKRLPSFRQARLRSRHAPIPEPVKAYSDWDRIMGSVNGCVVLPDGTITGAADPRRDGLAVGL